VGDSEFIGIEDFSKVDLRVARVLEAERVPGSKKLIRLVVDLGGQKRQIVAGLGKWYKPEEFLGKLIIIVANIKPKKLAGIESQGMLLATCDPGSGDRPVLLTVSEEARPGSKIC